MNPTRVNASRQTRGDGGFSLSEFIAVVAFAAVVTFGIVFVLHAAVVRDRRLTAFNTQVNQGLQGKYGVTLDPNQLLGGSSTWFDRQLFGESSTAIRFDRNSTQVVTGYHAGHPVSCRVRVGTSPGDLAVACVDLAPIHG